MQVQLNGQLILSERAFHAALANALALPAHYGANLDALWDVLGTDVERPVQLVWHHSAVSRAAMGTGFERIIDVLRRVERQDIEWNLPDRFALILE